VLVSGSLRTAADFFLLGINPGISVTCRFRNDTFKLLTHTLLGYGCYMELVIWALRHSSGVTGRSSSKS